MKLKVNRYSIVIIPESETDEAYIEEVLGLKDANQQAVCKRVNAMGLSCIAYIEIKKGNSS
ncbi:unnamed protein product [marine sediment metagenome]|uniref:Uncharacterized protein n=1 Tax=marine sediment metagenome TaxID=412755 RepID=X1BH54_9ZZZZ